MFAKQESQAITKIKQRLFGTKNINHYMLSLKDGQGVDFFLSLP
jgi:hypothetical protein